MEVSQNTEALLGTWSGCGRRLRLHVRLNAAFRREGKRQNESEILSRRSNRSNQQQLNRMVSSTGLLHDLAKERVVFIRREVDFHGLIHTLATRISARMVKIIMISRRSKTHGRRLRK